MPKFHPVPRPFLFAAVSLFIGFMVGLIVSAILSSI